MSMSSKHYTPPDWEFDFTFKVKARVDQLSNYKISPEQLIEQGIITKEDAKNLLYSLLTEELTRLVEQCDWDVDLVSERFDWSVTQVEQVCEDKA